MRHLQHEVKHHVCHVAFAVLEAPDRHAAARRVQAWHGSPSRLDSERPFIVANPTERASAIRKRVRRVLGDRPSQQKVTDVMLELRRSR